MRPLGLTTHIFKTSEPICVIFGILQHYFVGNIYVNSVLKKFITHVASPSDKVSNPVFHLQNQLRPLHSNAHISKMPVEIWTMFGTIQRRDILKFHNISIKFSFIRCVTKSDATWQNTTTCYSVIIGLNKNHFLKLSCFLVKFKCYFNKKA